MRKARKNVQIGLGAASILMIFVILCMMVLSVLSFARARQNEVTAIREYSYQQTYLKADTKAQILYELMKQNNANYTSMEALIKQPDILERLEEKSIVYHVEENVLSLEIKVNDTQVLSIKLNKTAEQIEKQSWKLLSTGGISK